MRTLSSHVLNNNITQRTFTLFTPLTIQKLYKTIKTDLDIFVGSAIGCGILVVAFSNFSELSLSVTSFWSACGATEIDDMGAFVPSPKKSGNIYLGSCCGLFTFPDTDSDLYLGTNIHHQNWYNND